jgi:hypothetical protein
MIVSEQFCRLAGGIMETPKNTLTFLLSYCEACRDSGLESKSLVCCCETEQGLVVDVNF